MTPRNKAFMTYLLSIITEAHGYDGVDTALIDYIDRYLLYPDDFEDQMDRLDQEYPDA